MAYFHSSLRLGALALGLVPAAAHAAPPEIFTGAVVHPTNPDVMVLRYENILGGLFYSADAAQTLRIRPGLTFTKSGLRAETSVAFAGDNVLIGSSDGLVKTDANGCFISNAISGAFVDAIATDPIDPGVAYFVTSRSNTVRSGLWQRDAKGANTPLGSDDGKDITVTSMQVVGTRIFQTAQRGTASLLRTSDDRGTTWREQPLAGTGTPRLLAIDPEDPQRILIAFSVRKDVDPVLVSRDGGATWQSYLDGVLQIGQATLAPDGRLWVADMGDDESLTPTGGLWFAPRIGEPPERLLSEIGVTCLAHDRTTDKLWLCQVYELDVFDPKTRGLCRKWVMTELDEFVQCDEDDLTRSVRAQDQLCGGYCGTRHFAQAGICENYNETSPLLCGLPARRDDNDAGWYDPAGQRASCTAAAMDAGVPSVIEDSGLPSNAIDAGVGEQAGRKDDGCALGSRSDAGGLLVALMLLLRRRKR